MELSIAEKTLHDILYTVLCTISRTLCFSLQLNYAMNTAGFTDNRFENILNGKRVYGFTCMFTVIYHNLRNFILGLMKLNE